MVESWQRVKIKVVPCCLVGAAFLTLAFLVGEVVCVEGSAEGRQVSCTGKMHPFELQVCYLLSK